MKTLLCIFRALCAIFLHSSKHLLMLLSARIAADDRGAVCLSASQMHDKRYRNIQPAPPTSDTSRSAILKMMQVLHEILSHTDRVLTGSFFTALVCIIVVLIGQLMKVILRLGAQAHWLGH